LDLFQECQQFPGTFCIFQGNLDPVLQFGAQHLQNIITQVFFGEDAVALLVNTGTLAVKDIIILKQMLADIKVRAFHPFLRLFHKPAKDSHLDRLAVVEHHTLPQTFDLCPAKKAHQFVFQ